MEHRTSTFVKVTSSRPVHVRWVTAGGTELEEDVSNVGGARDVAVHQSFTVHTAAHAVHVGVDKHAVLATAECTLLRRAILADDYNAAKACKVRQELLCSERDNDGNRRQTPY